MFFNVELHEIQQNIYQHYDLSKMQVLLDGAPKRLQAAKTNYLIYSQLAQLVNSNSTVIDTKTLNVVRQNVFKAIEFDTLIKEQTRIIFAMNQDLNHSKSVIDKFDNAVKIQYLAKLDYYRSHLRDNNHSLKDYNDLFKGFFDELRSALRIKGIKIPAIAAVFAGMAGLWHVVRGTKAEKQKSL